MSRPLAMTFTSRLPALSTSAYTLPTTRLDTNSVPLLPRVIARALLRPDAHSSTLKPAGTLILLTGIFSAASGAGGWGIGARGEFAISDDRPCCQVGGAAGGWARASGAPAERMGAP